MIKKILSKLKKKDSKSDKVKAVGKKTSKKVIIYSTHTCPWCAKAIEFFKENKVSYTNKFVDDNKAAAKEMIKKSGQQAVPVIDVGGQIIVGYSEGKLRKALGL